MMQMALQQERDLCLASAEGEPAVLEAERACDALLSAKGLPPLTKHAAHALLQSEATRDTWMELQSAHEDMEGAAKRAPAVQAALAALPSYVWVTIVDKKLWGPFAAATDALDFIRAYCRTHAVRHPVTPITFEIGATPLVLEDELLRCEHVHET